MSSSLSAIKHSAFHAGAAGALPVGMAFAAKPCPGLGKSCVHHIELMPIPTMSAGGFANYISLGKASAPDVYRVRDGLEVVGIAATTHPAFVIQFHAIWHFAERCPMNHDQFAVYRYPPIAIVVCVSIPQPAPGCWLKLNPVPKAFG
jgi:hypothetical protein